MQYQLGALATCVAVFTYVFLRRRRKFSAIRDVPGPVNPSWIFGTSPEGQHDPFRVYPRVDNTERENLQGHQWYILVEPAGGAEKRFLEDFGNVVHFNGPFQARFLLPGTRQPVALKSLTEAIGTCTQEDRLWIADPKAINHILQKSGYLYEKPAYLREGKALLTGRGIMWAHGELLSIISAVWLQSWLTIPQATYTSVTGEQWLRRLVSSRPKRCCHISWMLLPRHVNLVNI